MSINRRFFPFDWVTKFYNDHSESAVFGFNLI